MKNPFIQRTKAEDLIVLLSDLRSYKSFPIRVDIGLVNLAETRNRVIRLSHSEKSHELMSHSKRCGYMNMKNNSTIFKTVFGNCHLDKARPFGR